MWPANAGGRKMGENAMFTSMKIILKTDIALFF
jgi:hypothetical protein